MSSAAVGPRKRPPLDGRVIAILASWGVAVLVLAGLLSWAMWRSQQQQDQRLAEAEQRARAQSLAVVCAAFISQDEALNDPDSPPLSERAKRNAASWHALRVRFCPEAVR